MARRLKGLGSAPADHLKEAAFFVKSAKGYAVGASNSKRDCRHHMAMLSLAREDLGQAKAHLGSVASGLSTADYDGRSTSAGERLLALQRKLKDADEFIQRKEQTMRGKCVRK